VTFSSEPSSLHIKTVERFITAFNAHDSSAMASFVGNDIEWLSISGDQITVEVKGKGNLIESMNAYFKSCPTCSSELSSAISSINKVSAVEVASWKDAGGSKSQRAVSVYEFSEGKIIRVYYFSAEK
jgi:hypothetical protein